MHGKFRLLSLGKASCHSTVTQPFFSPVCSVFMVPYHQLWGLLFNNRWIFNVCTNLGACHTHEGGQAQTSLHKRWLGGTEKLFLILLRQGIEPKVFGFEFQLTIELCPPLGVGSRTTQAITHSQCRREGRRSNQVADTQQMYSSLYIERKDSIDFQEVLSSSNARSDFSLNKMIVVRMWYVLFDTPFNFFVIAIILCSCTVDIHCLFKVHACFRKIVYSTHTWSMCLYCA